MLFWCMYAKIENEYQINNIYLNKDKEEHNFPPKVINTVENLTSQLFDQKQLKLTNNALNKETAGSGKILETVIANQIS